MERSAMSGIKCDRTDDSALGEMGSFLTWFMIFLRGNSDRCVPKPLVFPGRHMGQSRGLCRSVVPESGEARAFFRIEPALHTFCRWEAHSVPLLQDEPTDAGNDEPSTYPFPLPARQVCMRSETHRCDGMHG